MKKYIDSIIKLLTVDVDYVLNRISYYQDDVLYFCIFVEKCAYDEYRIYITSDFDHNFLVLLEFYKWNAVAESNFSKNFNEYFNNIATNISKLKIDV